MKTIYKRILKQTLLLILTIHLSLMSFSATYYVSNSGNDANSGLTEALAWKTLAKVNTVAFVAGDQILFKRGDTFYGTLAMWRSGSSGSKITFGAYGTGANPIISAFATLSSWINHSGNIYYATVDVPRLNIVTLNGIVKGMGRFPDIGYLNYESHNAKTSITDIQLTGTPDWTGAEIGIRKYRWIIDRHIVTNHTASTLIYSSDQSYGNATLYEPLDGNGYFFQNHINCLNDLGDWCYNVSEKRIYMNFGGSSPSSYIVKAGNANRNLTINSQSHIDFTNIDFQGANTDGVYLVGVNNIDFNACNFTSQGGNAVYGISSGTISITGGSVTDALNNAIFFEYQADNNIIDGLTVTNSGIILGAGRSGDGASSGISVIGNNNIIRNCKVTNSGYCGINFSGDNVLVENNIVDTFCTIKDDGGGIYTYGGGGAIIRNNIVLNAIGSYLGSEWAYWENYGKAAGIYLDNGIANHSATVTGNSIAHGEWGGIFNNNNGGNIITNNTVYDFKYQLHIVNYSAGAVRNLVVTGNQFIAKTSTQKSLFNNMNVNESPSLLGSINSSYYARPIDDNLTIQTTIDNNTLIQRTFTQWQSYSGQDANSKKSPQSITSESDLQFEYNATTTVKTVALSRPMIDIQGTKYNTTITLQPFTSAVLMKDANPVQVVVPIYLGSSTENDTPTVLEMTYDTNLANVVPAASAFSVKVNSVEQIINSISISGPKVLLTLDRQLFYGDIVTLDYTKPSVNPIQTTSEGQASSVNSQSVINNVAILKQGSISPTHFIPVWQGENGLNHMNIMVISAMLEGLPLSPDDEIAVFSNSICVGSMKLSETIIADDNSTYLTIPVSQDDGSGNGFILNDTIVYKIWDNKNQQEMIAKTIVYRNNVSTWLTSGRYAAGATSVVELVSYTEYSQTIQLKKGYNMISTFVTAQNPLACDVTQSLANAGYLIKLQDEAGNSLEDWGTFGGWVNNIGSIKDTEGYKIKVTDNCSLQVTGRPIALPLDIPLRSGWNIISFPRTDLVDAMNIIQPLIDQNRLVKVQDEAGNSIENWGIFGGWKNGIGYFIPGKAYKIKMTSDAVLTIQENYLKSGLILAEAEETEYFSTEVEGNGSEHMNINIVGLRDAGISAGDELAAYDGKVCVGTIKITESHIADGSAALVASFLSDNLASDGFTEGHGIRIAAWNKLIGEELNVKMDVMSGQMSYAKSSSVLLKVIALTTDVKNFLDVVSIDIFPNPSQGKVTVRFSNTPDAGSSIDIVDISGRKVASRIITGISEVFNLDQQPAGVYLVKSKFGTNETIHKLVIN